MYKLRDVKETDINFILNSWLKSDRHNYNQLRDIEYYDEPVFNPCNNTEVDSKKVIRWEPYDCTK